MLTLCSHCNEFVVFLPDFCLIIYTGVGEFHGQFMVNCIITDKWPMIDGEI